MGNNQCLWYSVPRKDWNKTTKKTQKTDTKQTEINQYEMAQKKDTKSFFVRVGLGENGENDKMVQDQKEDENESDSSLDEEEIDGDDSTEEDEQDLNEIDLVETENVESMANDNRDNHKKSRCCTKPFSYLQWILLFTFFVSLQLCVVFAICDTKEIEEHDVSLPPQQ